MTDDGTMAVPLALARFASARRAMISAISFKRCAVRWSGERAAAALSGFAPTSGLRKKRAPRGSVPRVCRPAVPWAGALVRRHEGESESERRIPAIPFPRPWRELGCRPY
jgi:hypothetical protein